MKIRVIVWDLGGVHVDFFPADFIPKLANDDCKEPMIEHCFEAEIWQELDRGTVTEDEVVAHVLERVPAHCEPHVERIVKGWTEVMEGKESLVPIVERLHAAGYEQMILSNAGWRFPPYIETLPVSGYMSERLYSCEVNLLKPEPEIFKVFVERFGVVPEEILFIDDRLDNVESARACGWNAVQYVEPMNWAAVAREYQVPELAKPS